MHYLLSPFLPLYHISSTCRLQICGSVFLLLHYTVYTFFRSLLSSIYWLSFQIPDWILQLLLLGLIFLPVYNLFVLTPSISTIFVLPNTSILQTCLAYILFLYIYIRPSALFMAPLSSWLHFSILLSTIPFSLEILFCPYPSHSLVLSAFPIFSSTIFLLPFLYDLPF